MPRPATPAPTPEARLDETLLRHVRLVRPHLAPRGFKTDKWATIAAAVNRDVGHKVWRSGSGPQGRYGHLLTRFRSNKSKMTPSLRDRFKDYLAVLGKRGAAASRRQEQSSDGDTGEEEEEEEEKEDGEEEVEEEEEIKEEIEEVQFPRENRDDKEVDLHMDRQQRTVLVRPQAVAAPAPATSVALFHDTVTALREMTSGLLHVIEQDHAARREETQRNREDRKELLEVVRLALQSSE